MKQLTIEKSTIPGFTISGSTIQKSNLFVSLSIFWMLIFTSNAYANNASNTVTNAEGDKKRVAILISSYASSEKPEFSYDLEELAQAYLVLHSHNITIDIISPKGGSVLVKNNKDDLDYIQNFKQNTNALNQLKNTISSQNAEPDIYDGLFIIGGDGAMFDLPVDKATQGFISHFTKANLPLAAVCHGPAALVHIKDSFGEYILKGKRVNSFTSIEDKAFKGDALASYPFILEEKLKERGAIYVHNAPMLPYVSVDQNLITAQNPGSVAKTAEALITKIGLKVKARNLFKDEATLELIMRARSAGAYLINIEISSTPEKYDLNYLALYGFYSYQLAKDKQAKNVELNIMRSISMFFSHPMFDANLIKAEFEQGFKQNAVKRLNSFKKTNPVSDLIDELEAFIK